jgi:uncharacterized membrane protein YvbJ
LKCRNCFADNPDGAVVCVKCGATLPNIAGPATQPRRPLSVVMDDNRVPVAIMGLMFGLLGVILVIYFAARDFGYISGGGLALPVFFWIIGFLFILFATFKE